MHRVHRTARVNVKFLKKICAKFLTKNHFEHLGEFVFPKLPEFFFVFNFLLNKLAGLKNLVRRSDSQIHILMGCSKIMCAHG